MVNITVNETDNINYQVDLELGIELVGDVKVKVEVNDNLDDYNLIEEEKEDDIDKKIDEEVSARTAADEELHDMITAETQAREEEDDRLWEALSAETQAREEADEELHDMITAETQAREEADQELKDAIGNVNDIPGKKVDEYKPEDLILCGGTMSVFEFINSTNDYGYWETPNEPED